MSKKSRTPFPIHDEVDRAMLQVYKAACKLVTIAATDSSDSFASDAARALLELGTMAAIPVAAVIEQLPSETRRAMLLNLLREIPPHYSMDVPVIVMRVGASDPSESVRAAASETSEVLRRRMQERFKRLADLEALQYETLAEANGAAACP